MPKNPKVSINIDEDALRRAAQPGIDRIQAQVNETLQSTLREVRDEMSGQPADQVYGVLASRLQARIPGITLDESVLRGYAEAIEEGTLVD